MSQLKLIAIVSGTVLGLSACVSIPRETQITVDGKVYPVTEYYTPSSLGPDITTYEVEVDGVKLDCGMEIEKCPQLVRDQLRARNAVTDPSKTPQAKDKVYKGEIELTYDGFQGGA